LKHSKGKIKRFRSPQTNVKRLEDSSNNHLQNQKDTYKRMRRRSGKLIPEHPMNSQEDEETKRKLKEYLELKKGKMI